MYIAVSTDAYLTITHHRVQTSYVSVEPKRRKEDPSPTVPVAKMPSSYGSHHPPMDPEPQRGKGVAGRDLRRARIVITVQRTKSYEKWLEENQLQAIIAGDGDDDVEEDI